MKLKEDKALELTKEVWEWLAEKDGRGKEGWPGWKDNGGKYPRVTHNCFLCEYSGVKEHEASPESCIKCPYYQNYGLCCAEDNLYKKWEGAHSRDFAHEFAHRLKVILHNKHNPQNKIRLIGDTEFNEDTIRIMEAFYDFIGKTLHPDAKPDNVVRGNICYTTSYGGTP